MDWDNIKGLETITVAEGNSVYHSEGNCLIETATNTLLLGCKNSVIPQDITAIGGGAFVGCRCMTKLEIPNGVTEIGELAFADCRGLTSVSIPNSVNKIGVWF